jgi:hypothetical protein
MPPHHAAQLGDRLRDASRSSHGRTRRQVRRNFTFRPTCRLRDRIRFQLELDVPVGYRVRAGCSAITCGPPLRERSTHGPRNLCRARTEAPPARRAGKEPVPEYNSDSDTAPSHASDSNPLSGFYSNCAYEFDFGLDPEDPESEDNTTEQPLSGPASELVITSRHRLGDSSTGQTASPPT